MEIIPRNPQVIWGMTQKEKEAELQARIARSAELAPFRAASIEAKHELLLDLGYEFLWVEQFSGSTAGTRGQLARGTADRWQYPMYRKPCRGGYWYFTAAMGYARDRVQGMDDLTREEAEFVLGDLLEPVLAGSTDMDSMSEALADSLAEGERL